MSYINATIQEVKSEDGKKTLYRVMLGGHEIGTSKTDFDARFHMHAINAALNLAWDAGYRYAAPKEGLERRVMTESMRIRVHRDYPTMMRVLAADLGNAQDNRIRAEMQKTRMPFDHDNNDALERYIIWEQATKMAIETLKDLYRETA